MMARTVRVLACCLALSILLCISPYARAQIVSGSIDGGGGGGTVNSGTAGQAAYYAATGTAVSSSAPVTICSAFSGADDSLRLQACIAAAFAVNSTSAIIDARGLTGLTGTVDPYDASSISNSGVILMPCGTFVTNVPWVAHDNWVIKGCAPNSSNGVNYAIGGLNVPSGSALQASASFKTTYATGTVAVSGAGFAETVTGTGTSWSTNVVKGCAFVAPAGGLTNPSSWGIVHSVNSNTSITLGWGGNNGTDVSSGSTYDIYCPLYAHGDGSVEQDSGFEYGMGAETISFDCNNIAGCVPEMNWYGGQHTYIKNVNEYNFCGIGLDVEGIFAQNSGPYEDIVSAGGTCAGTGVKPFMFAPNGGQMALRNLSTNKGNSSSTPAVGIDLENSNITLEGFDGESVTVAVGINGNQACIPACQSASPWVRSAASNISVNNVYGGGSTNTAVKLFNTNGGPKSIHLQNIQGFGPHAVVDAINGCTSTSEQLGDYVLNYAGSISQSSSSVVACQPPPICSAYTVNFNNSTLAAAASTTAAVTLFTLPASGKITAINIKHSVAFTGTSITDATISIGWSGSATAYSSAFDIFQAVSNTAQYDDGGAFSATSASHAITANFTSVGGNLNALTSGSVTINACHYTIPTATVIP